MPDFWDYRDEFRQRGAESMTKWTGCGRNLKRQPLCWRADPKPNGTPRPMCEICVKRLEAKER